MVPSSNRCINFSPLSNPHDSDKLLELHHQPSFLKTNYFDYGLRKWENAWKDLKEKIWAMDLPETSESSVDHCLAKMQCCFLTVIRNQNILFWEKMGDGRVRAACQNHGVWKMVKSLCKDWVKEPCFKIPKNTYPFDCRRLYWIKKVREDKDLSGRRKEG